MADIYDAALDHLATIVRGADTSRSDFGAKAASYVDTFMKAIRWDNADRRFGERGTTRNRHAPTF